MRRLTTLLFILLLCGSCCCCADLLTYVQTPDTSFKWEKVSQSNGIFGTTYLLKMTSQTWQGIVWTHDIELIKPTKCDHPGAALMWITFGKPGEEQSQVMGMLAANAGCPVAILYGIPNQPLFGGLNEDALIAHTFVKTLETKDPTWPLLLPMTKSAVRAMDAVQAFSKEGLDNEIDRFVVSGASKRGWTTWLTAAVDPVRVKAIIPMVYDNLNLQAQMQHQIDTLGKFSDEIHDYTERGIQKALVTEEGRRLCAIVDPWAYRSLITMPKLIINGTNDPYWTQDSLNLYWDDIKGSKYVLYVPNGGHGLGDIPRVLAGISAFTKAVVSNAPLPKMSWKHTTGNGVHRLDVTVDPAGSAANLWVARSDTQDFHSSKWESSPMERTQTGFTGKVPLPTKGYTAVFGEVSVLMGGRTCNLSTQIAILGGT